MKLLAFSLFLLSAGSIQAQSLAGRRKMDEKYGFRDARFETDSTAMSGLKHAFDQAGLRYYERQTDNLHIGSADVANIYYGFAASKLCQIVLFVNGTASANAVYAALKEEYGPIYKLHTQDGMGWTSSTEVISMEEKASSGQTLFRFASRKMKDLEKEVRKAAAKKAASDL
jgi:hypothetical protein